MEDLADSGRGVSAIEGAVRMVLPAQRHHDALAVHAQPGLARTGHQTISGAQSHFGSGEGPEGGGRPGAAGTGARRAAGGQKGGAMGSGGGDRGGGRGAGRRDAAEGGGSRQNLGARPGGGGGGPPVAGGATPNRSVWK